jgi:hypothetical protein
MSSWRLGRAGRTGVFHDAVDEPKPSPNRLWVSQGIQAALPASLNDEWEEF